MGGRPGAQDPRSVKIAGEGNLTVDNALCEGIDSGPLPPTAPPF
jgi:hypothetical protein